jgi:hypothetical protein
MKDEEIKQAVDEYFKEMLTLDKDYVDHVTDSWIEDAEMWFRAKYIVSSTISSENEPSELSVFYKLALKKFDEIYDEQFGTRDAILRLHTSIQKLKLLRSDFERDKKFFKTFPTYDNVISTTFNNLCEYMQLLSDIEEGKVESLKK